MQILRLNDNRVPENPTPCFFTHIMCGTSVHDAAHDTSVISKQNLLLEFCADPKSRDEMQAYIDVSSRSHFSKYYLKPLLSSGKLEMMFPDKPF